MRKADLSIRIYADTLTDLKLSFHRVIIPVDEDIYLKNNFQFRFRNYASLSSSGTIESKASNADHWHIDYVVLNKDRSINDTIIGDVVICKPIGSLLKTYESLPWSHLDRAFSYEIKDSKSRVKKISSNTKALAAYFEKCSYIDKVFYCLNDENKDNYSLNYSHLLPLLFPSK